MDVWNEDPLRFNLRRASDRALGLCIATMPAMKSLLRWPATSSVPLQRPEEAKALRSRSAGKDTVEQQIAQAPIDE